MNTSALVRMNAERYVVFTNCVQIIVIQPFCSHAAYRISNCRTEGCFHVKSIAVSQGTPLILHSLLGMRSEYTNSTELHDAHLCETQSCPVQCQLCKRLCASPDHLHALRPGAIHLCGFGPFSLAYNE